MGKSLRVLDSGSWSTVDAPYIMDGGSWKTVHKVWVMSGGTWKESHITPYTSYASGSGGQSTTSTSGTWTVPSNTKYIRVTILGNGGGGGGSNRTNSYHDKTASANSGDPPWTSSVSTADGGDGGAGGKAEVVLEVEAGTVFTYTNLGDPGAAGAQDDAMPNQNQTQGSTARGNLHLRRNNYDSEKSITPPPAAIWSPASLTPTSTSTLQLGNDGVTGSTIVFSGASAVGGDYNIEVYGGAGGAGARLFVSSWSVFTSAFGEKQAKYTITVTAGNNGSDGGQTSAGGNRVVTTMTSGGGGAGGAGGDATATFAPGGSTGTGGSITIETYQGI